MEVTPAAVDAILGPSAVLMLLGYHAFLFFKLKRSPYETAMGVNQRARRLWVKEMLRENHKKNVLAVQTIRNSIMESTLMATMCVILTTGLATYFTLATNTLKQPPLVGGGGENQGVFGSLKSLAILMCFMVAFLCHTQSIRFLNHVNYTVNIPIDTHLDDTHITNENYLANLLEHGAILYSFGSRIFYLAISLLFWLFGSIVMFLGSLVLLYCLYLVDFVQVPNISAQDHINVRKKISDHKEPPIDFPSNYLNQASPHHDRKRCTF